MSLGPGAPAARRRFCGRGGAERDWRRAIRASEVEARLKQDKEQPSRRLRRASTIRAPLRYNESKRYGQAIKASGQPALFLVRFDYGGFARCMPSRWRLGIDVAMSG